MKYLFVGNYFSNKRGTKPVMERVTDFLYKNFKIQYKIVSKIENRALRVIDVALHCLFSSYDVVHIDVFSGLSFRYAELAAGLASFRKKKIILNLRGGGLAAFDVEPGHHKHIVNLFKKADTIVTPSLFLKEYFERPGFKIEYLPNFIDLTNFRYGRKVSNLHSLLWIRGFGNIYNPHLAVKILFELKKQFADATLTMIGPDGGLLENTKELIRRLNLENNITIVGPVKNSELEPYYQSHAVYINTTSFESFGVALMEAASCGIPIVSTRVGEVPYIWDENEDILTIENFDAEQAASKISEIFNNPSLAEKLSVNASKKANKYTWEAVSQNWKSLLGS